MWCAIGAVAGWLAGLMMTSTAKVVRIEEVLVGMFGAVIGAEVMRSMYGTPDDGVTPLGIGAAVGGAVLLLALLRVMRRAVGPMRAGKSPSARRR